MWLGNLLLFVLCCTGSFHLAVTQSDASLCFYVSRMHQFCSRDSAIDYEKVNEVEETSIQITEANRTEDIRRLESKIGFLENETKNLNETLLKYQETHNKDIGVLKLENKNLNKTLQDAEGNYNEEIGILENETKNLKETLLKNQETHNEDVEMLKLENKNSIKTLQDVEDNSNQEIGILENETKNLNETLLKIQETHAKDIEELKLENKNLNKILQDIKDNSNEEIEILENETTNLKETLLKKQETHAKDIEMLNFENKDLKKTLQNAEDNYKQGIEKLGRAENLRANGWQEAGNGLFYKIFPTQVNYATAKGKCVKEGGILGAETVRNPLLFRKMEDWTKDNKQNIWVGLDDIVQEMRWVWMDGRVSDSSTRWLPGQPSTNHIENCAVLSWNEGGLIHDYPCSATMAYICEKTT